MRLLRRHLKRRRNIQRLLAGAFLVIAFAELGSHVIMDSQDPNIPVELAACRLSDAPSNRADCPDQRQQQRETKNLLDEMTTHMVVLNDLTMPHSGVMYRTNAGFYHSAVALSGEPTLPFHPPKQA